MNWQLLWFVLAGLVLGFALSTLWEWFYFRRERMIVRDERITELETQLRAYEAREREQQTAAPPWTAPGYQGPGVLLESERTEETEVLVTDDDQIEPSDSLPPRTVVIDDTESPEFRTADSPQPLFEVEDPDAQESDALEAAVAGAAVAAAAAVGAAKLSKTDPEEADLAETRSADQDVEPWYAPSKVHTDDEELAMLNAAEGQTDAPSVAAGMAAVAEVTEEPAEPSGAESDADLVGDQAVATVESIDEADAEQATALVDEQIAEADEAEQIDEPTEPSDEDLIDGKTAAVAAAGIAAAVVAVDRFAGMSEDDLAEPSDEAEVVQAAAPEAERIDEAAEADTAELADETTESDADLVGDQAMATVESIDETSELSEDGVDDEADAEQATALEDEQIAEADEAEQIDEPTEPSDEDLIDGKTAAVAAAGIAAAAVAVDRFAGMSEDDLAEPSDEAEVVQAAAPEAEQMDETAEADTAGPTVVVAEDGDNLVDKQVVATVESIDETSELSEDDVDDEADAEQATALEDEQIAEADEAEQIDEPTEPSDGERIDGKTAAVAAAGIAAAAVAVDRFAGMSEDDLAEPSDEAEVVQAAAPEAERIDEAAEADTAELADETTESDADLVGDQAMATVESIDETSELSEDGVDDEADAEQATALEDEQIAEADEAEQIDEPTEPSDGERIDGKTAAMAAAGIAAAAVAVDRFAGMSEDDLAEPSEDEAEVVQAAAPAAERIDEAAEADTAELADETTESDDGLVGEQAVAGDESIGELAKLSDDEVDDEQALESIAEQIDEATEEEDAEQVDEPTEPSDENLSDRRAGVLAAAGTLAAALGIGQSSGPSEDVVADEPTEGRKPEEIHGYPDNLSRVKGIGKVYRRRLYEAGIFTWDQLSRMSVDEINEIAHPFVSADVEEWPERARVLAERYNRVGAQYVGPAPDDLTEIRGIGPFAMQKLYKGGIWSFQQLAAISPEDLKAIIPASPNGEAINYERWIEIAVQLSERASN